MPASISLDLGQHDVAPHTDKPNVMWISVQMKNPREDGLSSQEEFETLAHIEDTLVHRVTTAHNAVFVGRLTSSGHRDFYFYLGDTDGHDKAIREVMHRYGGYEFDFGVKEDKTWDGYFNFLYPEPIHLQEIKNMQLFRTLQEYGDNPEIPREVNHWIYFRTENDRENFLEKIKSDGFETKHKDNKSDGEYPYGLQISRVDKVTPFDINDYGIYLWQTAQDCNAQYDGWETSIEK